MGLVLQSEQGDVVTFRATAVVGRSDDAALCLSQREISSRHAELRWTSSGWAVRDLGSTNGTFVDGDRLAAGEERLLTRGSRVGFANLQGWTVKRADEPQCMATSNDGRKVYARGDVIALPDDADPHVSVVASERGWVAEWRDGRTETTHDGDVLDVQGTPWRLSLAIQGGETSELGQAPFLHDVSLHFEVSRDEEHVQTTVRFFGSEHVLAARTHHYTLLTLARCRLQDQRAGELPEAEQGWVLQSRLERMLAVGQNVVYKHIFRSRRELTDLGVVGASDIIERRPAAGQLRIGVSSLSVARS